MQASRIRWAVRIVQIGLLATAGSALAATGKVYVADEEASTVSVIDTASFNLIRSIPVGKGPQEKRSQP